MTFSVSSPKRRARATDEAAASAANTTHVLLTSFSRDPAPIGPTQTVRWPSSRVSWGGGGSGLRPERPTVAGRSVLRMSARTSRRSYLQACTRYAALSFSRSLRVHEREALGRGPTCAVCVGAVSRRPASRAAGQRGHSAAGRARRRRNRGGEALVELRAAVGEVGVDAA